MRLLKKDLTSILTAGVVRNTQITDESENLQARQICRTIKANVDPDEIEKKIAELVSVNDDTETRFRKAQGNHEAMKKLLRNSDIEDLKYYYFNFHSSKKDGISMVRARLKIEELERQLRIITDFESRLVWQDNGYSEKHAWDESFVYCENLYLGGYKDWRLPNKDELASLFWNKKILNSYQSSYYWTASTAHIPASKSYVKDYAWFVDFSDGYMDDAYRKDHREYVRCVRGQPKSSLKKKYIVIDKVTNLMWQNEDILQYLTWENGKKYCEELRFKGCADWRLPTIQELKGLYKRRKILRTYKFENQWSSKKNWYVIFDKGGVEVDLLDLLTRMYGKDSKEVKKIDRQGNQVRCVRSKRRDGAHGEQAGKPN